MQDPSRPDGKENRPNLSEWLAGPGIDLASKPDAVGKRGFEAMELAFHDQDLMVRGVGDTLALSPPLIVSESQIGEIFEKVARTVKAVA